MMILCVTKDGNEYTIAWHWVPLPIAEQIVLEVNCNEWN